jgi:SAM-dependent methyltransferase
MKFFLIALVVIILIFGLVVLRGAPYVPSKRRDLRRALTELYPLGDKDVLVDIGSGDGVVLRMAAEQGARAVGFELNPVLVGVAKLLSRRDRRVTVRLADFWLVKLPSDTTVVYVFGESRDIAKMASRVAAEAQRLKKTIYLISYGFEVEGVVKVQSTSTHHLYRFEPLQSNQP